MDRSDERTEITYRFRLASAADADEVLVQALSLPAAGQVEATRECWYVYIQVAPRSTTDKQLFERRLTKIAEAFRTSLEPWSSA